MKIEILSPNIPLFMRVHDESPVGLVEPVQGQDFLYDKDEQKSLWLSSVRSRYTYKRTMYGDEEKCDDVIVPDYGPSLYKALTKHDALDS